MAAKVERDSILQVQTRTTGTRASRPSGRPHARSNCRDDQKRRDRDERDPVAGLPGGISSDEQGGSYLA
jgi:hypothetical protein